MAERPGGPPAVKLRMVRYLHEGQPYTAFVALDDLQYSDVIAADTGDLTAYRDRILRVYPGHEPTDAEVDAVRQAFAQVYGAKHTGRTAGG